jgi:hypothetical protein
LQAAVSELFPRLKRGELPSARQLGTKLRSLRSRNFGGRAIEGKRSNRGVVWTIGRVAKNGELPFDEERKRSEP